MLCLSLPNICGFTVLVLTKLCYPVACLMAYETLIILLVFSLLCTVVWFLPNRRLVTLLRDGETKE